MYREKPVHLNPDEILPRLKTWAHERRDVVALYLFGSRARGSPHAFSDVDLAVLLVPDYPDDLKADLALMGEIGRLVGIDEVDVVILNSARLRLRAEVVQTGRLLACNDDDARILFEVRTMSEWWDFKPVLDAYDRAFMETVEDSFTDEQRREYQRALEAFAQTDRAPADA